MGDQIVGVLVVLAFIDEVADVMENCGKFEPLAFGLAQMMEAFGLVEEPQGETGDMEAMGFRDLAAPRQRHDVAAPQIRNVGFRFESFTMADDEIVDDAFTNGLVAEDEFVSSDSSIRRRRTTVAGNSVSTRLGSSPGIARRSLIVD